MLTFATLTTYELAVRGTNSLENKELTNQLKYELGRVLRVPIQCHIKQTNGGEDLGLGRYEIILCEPLLKSCEKHDQDTSQKNALHLQPRQFFKDK